MNLKELREQVEADRARAARKQFADYAVQIAAGILTVSQVLVRKVQA